MAVSDGFCAVNQADDLERALGIAVQVLEDLPERLRPASNIEDMKALIAGETTDRAGLLLVQAVATALAFRVQSALANPQQWNREDATEDTEPVGFNNRVQEFTALLELAKSSDARMLALLLVEALDRLAQAERKNSAD
jgi:hypothetical protein